MLVELQEKREQLVDQLIPEAMSRDIYDKTIALLKEFRRQKAGGAGQ
jgi:hypothetical protein